MQRGTIVRQNKKWCLRYYETVLKDSRPVRKKSFKVLAPICKDYPSKTSVLPLADKILSPINTKQQAPESSLRLTDFIENHYLPWARLHLRPSTVKGYEKDIYNIHLKSRLGDIRLRDFRTVIGQRLIAQIPDVGHKTLQRVKSFLSGVLTYALRQGILDGSNPMHPVKVPGRPAKFKGGMYTLQEIFDMNEAVTEYEKDRRPKKFTYQEVPKGTANAVILTAAFAGLRLSELRGLRWNDYDGKTLNVSRSVWRTHVGQTKTSESEASVPVLPFLSKVLENYRKVTKGKPEDYIFAGPRRNAPLNLHNLSARVIKRALKEKNIGWKGWHSFRRGLASNLYELGVSPKVIQGILRHSDIGTTLQFYTQVPEEASREALQRIEDSFLELLDKDSSEVVITSSDGKEVSLDVLLKSEGL